MLSVLFVLYQVLDVSDLIQSGRLPGVDNSSSTTTTTSVQAVCLSGAGVRHITFHMHINSAY